MSKHSKHGRGKHSHFKRAQKRQQMQMNTMAQSNTSEMQPTTNAIQQTPSATPMTPKPAVVTSRPQPQMQRRSSSTAALPLHYEFIAGDLKRIGILTVAVLVILVVLYIFIR
jgi:hypothetical protein